VAPWSSAAQSSLRSQAGSCRLAAGPRGLPSRSAALAAERRSVRQRSQVLPPSGVEESCWLGRRHPAARALSAAFSSSRSRASPAPSAGPLRGVSGSASPPAGFAQGRRRGRRCAWCRVLVLGGASASCPTPRAARPHGSNRFSRTVVSACLTWGSVLGGSRRSVARCLTRRCSWQAQAAAQWGNAAQSSLRSQVGSAVWRRAGWATVSGQRRSQLSADPVGSVLRYSLPLEW
jgi:hypothetical protein